MKKRIKNILIFIVSFILVERFCYFQTQGFREYKIHSVLPFNSEWETPTPSETVIQTLSQPFTFLGKGAQFFAFLGKDQTTVLKVFKHHRLTDFPNKTAFIFESCKIASNLLQEETGVIYAHLNKTDFLEKTLLLYDNIHNAHFIDADSIEFVLQKKAEPIYPTLQTLIKNNDLEGAKRRISSLFDLSIRKCEKRVGDRDPLIFRNFGFVGETAVEIDLGSFYKAPWITTKREFLHETLPFKKWIAKHCPELTSYVEEQINIRMEAHYDKKTYS